MKTIIKKPRKYISIQLISSLTPNKPLIVCARHRFLLLLVAYTPGQHTVHGTQVRFSLPSPVVSTCTALTVDQVLWTMQLVINQSGIKRVAYLDGQYLATDQILSNQ
jgi:hypothetical protein